MRFHVLSLPHTQTTKEYTLCAYTEKVRKFCNMMKSLGHTVFLYASEDNEADCDELITVATKADQLKWFGNHDYKSKFFNLTWDLNEEHWQVTNQRAADEIAKRKEPHDFICTIAGMCQKQVADLHPDLMTVEFGIGYSGTFSAYRVFESYAWMHSVYGAYSDPGHIMSVQGRFYDEVIPNYFETEDFPFSLNKEDYYLFIGRLTELKGFDIAVDVCKKLGKRLIIAGQGTPPTFGEFVGSVGPEKRGELMSKAKAVFVPSLYLEPFGGVHAEAMMCGTPVITTDWGAFPENVVEGVTGYRCRTMAEFVKAAENVSNLNPQTIRGYAVGRFSTDVVRYQYEDYFERLLTLWDKGFYT
jgi:glycosyltransferase involved in cell wall biosynthesis